MLDGYDERFAIAQAFLAEAAMAESEHDRRLFERVSDRYFSAACGMTREPGERLPGVRILKLDRPC